MYTIKGVLSEKFYPNGELSRFKQPIQITLNTEAGVLRFIEEQKPFASIEVIEVETKLDKTEYFLKDENGR